MARKTLSCLIALVALAVGYALGSGPIGAPRPALAGPTEAARGWGGDWITSHGDGDTLTVWKMKDGACVEASHYVLDTSSTRTDKGEPTTGRIFATKLVVRPDGK